MSYERPEAKTLKARLGESVRFMTIIAGPRQVGKTTLVRSVLKNRSDDCSLYIAVDQPIAPLEPDASSFPGGSVEGIAGKRDAEWLSRQWQRARALAKASNDDFILVFDEIQKVPQWSETVKGLWDADRAEQLSMHVVLLGSSPLLMQKGLTESLVGRYELVRLTHWSYSEMQDAFDFNLNEYIYFGGFPGGAPLIRDEPRWRNYVRASLIEPNIEKDILMMTRVDKPALLKQLFRLGSEYSGQILSYTKMLGQLHDAGNTVTLAHYLDLLAQAGFIIGLQKYSGSSQRKRASSPKLNVLNTALMTSGSGYSYEKAIADRTYWGRLVESSIGAHLVNTSSPECQVYYWRKSPFEVDFIIKHTSGKRVAIEVKSGLATGHAPGLDAFETEFGSCRKILVGDGSISIAELLSQPTDYWIE